MPVHHWQLTGDHGRAGLIALVEDFQQIPAPFVIERGQPPVVEHQDLDLGERGHEFEVTTVGPGEGEFLEQAWQALVKGGMALPASGIGQGASEVRLPRAGRNNDILLINGVLKPFFTTGITHVRERVQVLGCRDQGHEAYYLLEQSDGSRAFLPAWMFEPRAAELTTVQQPRLSVRALTDLRRIVDHFLSSRALRPRTPTSTGGVDEASEPTTARSVSAPRTDGVQNSGQRALDGAGASGQIAVDRTRTGGGVPDGGRRPR